MQRMIVASKSNIFLMGETVATAYARRDCCSWHKGVAYCDQNSGKLVCHGGHLFALLSLLKGVQHDR